MGQISSNHHPTSSEGKNNTKWRLYVIIGTMGVVDSYNFLSNGKDIPKQITRGNPRNKSMHLTCYEITGNEKG